MKVEDCPRELGAEPNTPALASKETWSQGDSCVHDFADRHGQDSQQDRFSTQGVDTPSIGQPPLVARVYGYPEQPHATAYMITQLMELIAGWQNTLCVIAGDFNL